MGWGGRPGPLVALLCSVVLTASPVAFADPAADPPSVDPASRAASFGARELLGGTSELDEAWFTAQQHLADSNFDAAFAHLERIAVLRRQLGVPNYFGMADVVLLHAIEAADKGLGAEATTLVDHAGTLAPDSPRVPMVRFEVRLTVDGVSTDAFGDVAEATSLQLSHLSERVLLFGRLAAAGMLAVLWCIVLFGVAMLLRHGSRLAFDLGLILPAAMRGVPFMVLGVVALIGAPLSVGMGLLLMTMAWLVILWPYFALRERIVGAVLAGAVALVPQLNGQYESALLYPASRDEALYRCEYGRCAPPYRARLEAALARNEATVDEMLALALQSKRYGAGTPRKVHPLNKAVVSMTVARQRGERSYRAAVNKANALFTRAMRECSARGSSVAPKMDEVDSLYRLATELDPSPVEAEYNRSVMLARLGQQDDADAALGRARALAPERVVVWEAAAAEVELKGGCPKSFNGNVHLVDGLVGVGERADQVRARAAGTGTILVPFGYLLAGIVDASFLPLVGIVVALLLLIGAVFARVLRPAYHCKTCGRVASERIRRELVGLSICERCLFIRIKGSFVDSRDKWLRDRGIQATADLRGVAARVLSFIVPGLGQLVRGHAVRGAVFLVLFVFAGTTLVLSPTLLPDPALVGTAGLGVGILSGVVMAGTYVISAIDAMRS